MNLYTRTKLHVLYPGSTAATSGGSGGAIQSTKFIDMSRWDGVMLFTGIIDTTAGLTTGMFGLVPQMSTAASTSLLTSLPTSCIAGDTAAFSTGDKNKLAVVDIYRPTERYISAKVTLGASGTIMLMPIIGITYGGSFMPTTNSSSDVLDANVCISPTT